MNIVRTTLEIWLSQFCDEDAVSTSIVQKGEEIWSNLGCRNLQNYEIPWHSYSIRDWGRLLLKKRKPRPFKNHDSMLHILNHNEKYSDYFSFCFERNPWDKVVSLYYYSLYQRGAEPYELSLDEFIQNAPHRLSNWDRYTNKQDEIIVDYVAKFENLEEELEEICHRIGISRQRMGPLPRAKTKHRKSKPYRELLTDENAEKVRQLCKKEIEYLDYTFDGKSETKVTNRSDKQFSSKANKRKKKGRISA